MFEITIDEAKGKRNTEFVDYINNLSGEEFVDLMKDYKKKRGEDKILGYIITPMFCLVSVWSILIGIFSPFFQLYIPSILSIYFIIDGFLMLGVFIVASNKMWKNYKIVKMWIKLIESVRILK